MGFGLGKLGKIAGGALGLGAASGIAGSTVGAVAGDFIDFGQDLELQNRNMDFQRDMYRNRYQYTVQDMAKAGLNPMLAYSQGVGGSVGSAGQGNSGTVASAQMAQNQLQAQTRLLDAQADNLNADTKLKETGSKRGEFEISTTLPAQAERDMASAGYSHQQIENLRAELPKIAAMVEEINAGASLKKMQEWLTGLEGDKLKALLPALKSLTQSQAAAAAFGLPGAENKADLAEMLHDWIFGPAGQNSAKAKSKVLEYADKAKDWYRQHSRVGASGAWSNRGADGGW